MLTRLVDTFTGGGLLAIVLAALGLYALSATAIERRTKEIGMRKVLGSSSSNITWLLLFNQIKPVLIALLFALPCGYPLSDRILQYFPNSVPLSAAIFALAVAISLGVAWLTMAAHIFRAANGNPIIALREE